MAGIDRRGQLQVLTDAALAHLDLDDLLDALLLRTRELLAVDTVAVLLLDEEAAELRARAAVGLEESVERGTRIPMGRGFAGRVAASQQPVVLDDVDHADVLNPVLREKGVKSLLGVPLIAHGHVLGVLHVGSLTPRQFGADDIELLQLAADRAAIAIEHARLFAAERTARRRIEDLQAVTDAALAHLEVDELLKVLLPRIRDIVSADTCAVLLLDEAQGQLVARAAVGIEEEVERGVRIPLGEGFAGRVAAGGRPVILEDVDHADVLNPILHEKGIKSMLGVPLIVRSRVLGVLHVGTLVPRLFTRDDVELLQLVAERVALAIERAQLHEETVELEQLRLSFVAIASHELRTPATSVYGVLATLVHRGDQLSEETKDELLRSGLAQGERLRVLLEELLDLSRLDSSALTVNPRMVSLGETLKEIAHRSVPGAQVRVEVAADVEVSADVIVVDRVISNLLINAVRYGAEPIRITAEESAGDVRIRVEDEGAGVPEHLVTELFDRFARASEGGSGLGLAIAQGYARAHGGDLLYAPEGRGARFEFILPQD